MSFKVLVIPEDPTNNGYILKPLIEAILADAGKPRAKVTVLTSPRVRGFDDAVRAIREELPDKYAHLHLWIFVPDADRATPAIMEALEKESAAKSITLFCCAAVPEVEIYCCAGRAADLGISWAQARAHQSFKESCFEPFLEQFGDSRRAGGGRDLLVQQSIANMDALCRLCPELKTLRDRIRALAGN